MRGAETVVKPTGKPQWMSFKEVARICRTLETKERRVQGAGYEACAACQQRL